MSEKLTNRFDIESYLNTITQFEKQQRIEELVIDMPNGYNKSGTITLKIGEESLLEAIKSNDKERISDIEKRAKNGERIRLI